MTGNPDPVMQKNINLSQNPQGTINHLWLTWKIHRYPKIWPYSTDRYVYCVELQTGWITFSCSTEMFLSNKCENREKCFQARQLCAGLRWLEKNKVNKRAPLCAALMNTWGNTQAKCDFLRDKVMNAIRPLHTHHYSELLRW